jgi:hypothetical protein
MSKYFDAELVQERFNVPLSERYRRFLKRKEWRKYDGLMAEGLYGNPIAVRFQGEELESFFHDDWPADAGTYGHVAAPEIKLGGSEGWVPLATLGEEESQFLVVKADDEACPVALYEYEDQELVRVADTLDGFLKGLAKAGEMDSE